MRRSTPGRLAVAACSPSLLTAFAPAATAGDGDASHGSTLWTYDDPQVLRAKSRYVRDHGLGGAMFWSLDADPADGELMTAVDQGLRGGR